MLRLHLYTDLNDFKLAVFSETGKDSGTALTMARTVQFVSPAGTPLPGLDVFSHITIGPCTEATMGDYNISHKESHRLLKLTQTVSNREWAAAMQGSDFGFSANVANAMSKAMFTDVYGPIFGPPAVSTGAKVIVVSDATGLQLNTDTHWKARDKVLV